MSRNRFDGTIPQWMGSFGSSLQVLNLQGNNFHGSLYRCLHESMNSLLTLDQRNKKLQGKVPKTLINCSKLEVLNLEHNRISETFPFWSQNLPNLQVLVLGGNKFHSPIWHPHKFSGFVNLRIIDLSFNNFSLKFIIRIL